MSNGSQSETRGLVDIGHMIALKTSQHVTLDNSAYVIGTFDEFWAAPARFAHAKRWRHRNRQTW